jgi:muconolactone D-isomerase
MEFLTFGTIAPPVGIGQSDVDARIAQEATRAAELVAGGALLRIWRPPSAADEWKNVGLWEAPSEAELHLLLDSLPMREWMTLEVLPLAEHPSDPGHA